MSRFNPHHTNIDTTLFAVEKWRDDCLLNGKSIFSGDDLWNIQGLAALNQHFTDNPDFTQKNFYTKLNGQLEDTAAPVKKLMAEILWVMQLFPSKIQPSTKRNGITDVWGWSGDKLQPSHPMLADEVLGGVGSTGPAFSMHRPLELRFAINAFTELLALPRTKRADLLEDPWGFAEWLETIFDEGYRQLKHILPFLLFPDDFERISSPKNFREILTRVDKLPASQVKKMTKIEIDRAVSDLRRRLEQIENEPIDFYEPKFRSLWATVRPPNWNRDEVVLAMHLYMPNRNSPPGKTDSRVLELSDLLRQLAIFNGQRIDDKYRNANGVYLKMMNLRAFDPLYTELGNVGMRSGSALDRSIWDEFNNDIEGLDNAAQEIREIICNPVLSDILQGKEEAGEGYQEGGVRYRLHRTYERSAKLIAEKRASLGTDARCDACSFSFREKYGQHGDGYIEVHHLKPVHTIKGKHKTRVEDLAALCANCHRMIHRQKSVIMTLEQLREIIQIEVD